MLNHALDVEIAKIAKEDGWSLPDASLIEFGVKVWNRACQKFALRDIGLKVVERGTHYWLINGYGTDIADCGIGKEYAVEIVRRWNSAPPSDDWNAALDAAANVIRGDVKFHCHKDGPCQDCKKADQILALKGDRNVEQSGTVEG